VGPHLRLGELVDRAAELLLLFGQRKPQSALGLRLPDLPPT